MSQLKLFLEVLTPEEAEKIQISVRKIGKQKQVFLYVKSKLNKEMEVNAKVLEKLQITESHFHKTTSVLLSKCYEALFPEGGLPLLLFLKDRNLPSHFKHEIGQSEKVLVKQPKSESLNKYYLKVFHLLIDMPFSTYDEKLTALAGKRYLETLADCTPAWENYIKFHILFSDINRLSAKKNKKLRERITLEKLLNDEKYLENTNHYLARYYLYRSFCSFYIYLEPNPIQAQHYLLKAISLKDEIAWFYPINIGKFLDLLYADMLFFNNEKDESYTIYQRVFSSPLEVNMYGFYYHCEQYVLINLLKENYVEAEKALKQYFDEPIKQRLDIHATRGAMGYAKLYLSKGQLKDAFHYLNVCKEINENATYHPFEFQIRVLEVVYFFFKSDYEFTEHLCQRNIKMILANSEGKRYATYLAFYKLLSTFIHNIQKKTPITKRDKNKFVIVDNFKQNLYVRLPQMVLQKVIHICGEA